jgi:hypothetical protein
MKLMEFGSSGDGTMKALAVLLASGNGRGGGDLRSADPLVGSWAGDRIMVVGDYSDIETETGNLYGDISETYEDISAKIIKVFVDAGEDIRQE